jgi:DNA-binding transcriptional LysR family regulator
MLDGITFDQVRTFLAAVDEGSFSAAGRKLGRAQSVVSQTLATMEERLGIRLFERVGRYPRLTAQGQSLVADARAILAAMSGFKERAGRLAGGLETEVAFTVDVMVPLDLVARAANAFEARFPETALRLTVDALGGVLQPLVAGTAAFAVAGPMATEHPALVAERFSGVAMVAVAAPIHEAAQGPTTLRDLCQHRQLVLTDRSELSRDREFGVLSSSTWRLSDLAAKRALLKAGLGWGAMPRPMVSDDLADGSLVALAITDANPAWMTMPLHLAYSLSQPPGIAGRWLMDRLRQEAG